MLKKIKKGTRRLLGIRSDTDYYSQGGEDAIISKIFSFVVPVSNGFYVDIGAYHPFIHSNTFILYKAGWNGLNIDPRPGFSELFKKHRPRDINVEMGVAGKAGTMTYYVIDENSTMNSFSRENLERLNMLDQVKKQVSIQVNTLTNILQQYAPGINIDYLNIDAEGFEMEILEGLDFRTIEPSIISIEQNQVLNFEDVTQSQACRFLHGLKYSPVAKNIILKDVATVFYLHNRFI